MGRLILVKKEIFLITDYRNQFYEAVRYRGASFDIEQMRMYFSNMGYDLRVMQFGEVDFQSINFKGSYILYQSSEDRGLLYKDYVEDILLGFMIQGATLIPAFPQFRAHHNKVFMEIFRSVHDSVLVKGIASHGYGTYEEFARDIGLQPEKVVMKPASGARSSGVRLVDGHAAQLRYARNLSSSFHVVDFMKRLVNSIIRKNYPKKSLHRRKFIVQEFLPGLDGDYKILIYGEKYYVLQRTNRKNDFRASGSGKFTFPVSPPSELLNFAKDIFTSFQVPFISMDIAKCESHYVLLEFQFLCFGNYTLERSKFYFAHSDENGWQKIDETPDLEREFVVSVVRYVDIISKTDIGGDATMSLIKGR
jgi:hypothetical protein